MKQVEKTRGQNDLVLFEVLPEHPGIGALSFQAENLLKCVDDVVI
ncbi:MAG: hypothetical protein WBB19_10530 [Desulforhopalus sp.]